MLNQFNTFTRKAVNKVKNSKAYRTIDYRIKGLAPLEKQPIFILGNQKSGTSAIAALLAERTGLSYTIDLKHEIDHPIFDKVIAGTINIDKLISNNRPDFTNKIIKEPNITFMYQQLKEKYPDSKFVMVMRDPFDNIRSLCNRHNIDGSWSNLPPEKMKELSPAWKAIYFNHGIGIEANSFIEHMAARWDKIAEIYLNNKSHIELIKYEDFKIDKLGELDKLANVLHIETKNNIAHLLNKNFQKPGKQDTDLTRFFGENYKVIDHTTKANAKVFGYES